MKTAKSAKTSIEKPASREPENPVKAQAEMRDRLIAEAAYYRAEARGFAPGHDLEDWLEAEAEIDRSVPSSGGLQD